jgi:hypothetical protein
MNKHRTRANRGMEQAQDWPAIHHPITCREALTRLTKDDMNEMRKRFGVTGASTLKKQELAGVLAGATLQQLPDVLARMDQTRYDVLKKVANQGGAAAVEADILMVDYFEGLGILFRGSISGTNELVMPQEMLEAFRVWDSKDRQAMVRRNTEWIRLAQGLLHYYGVLTWEDLKQFVMQYNGEDDADYTLFEPVIRDSGNYQASLVSTQDTVAHIDVMDSELVRSEQEQLASLPFYPLSKHQALQASDPEYIEKTPSFQAFVKYLMQQYGMTRAEAEEEVDLIVYDIKLGDSPSQLMENVQDKFELTSEPMVNDFIRLLSDLMNNTRLWFLKGYAPSEVRAALDQPNASPGEQAVLAEGSSKAEIYPFATKQKVGRNDPCPCGSGKKFKKCCGS